MKLQFTLLLLFTAWLVPAGSAHAQVSNPSGDLTTVQNEDIWAQTLKGNHFNEFWTYQFYLNNDLTVHITFSVANFGSLKSPVSGVQISVDRLNGEIYQLSREYDLDYLVQDRENLMFRNRDQRKIYFIGELPKEHRVRIHTSKDGVEYDIDLSMHNIQHGIKWDDGIYQIGEEKVGIYTHIPYASVSGYVSVDGHRQDVSGSVFMDHTFQNETTTRLIDSAYRFINHQDSRNWDILYFMDPDRGSEDLTIGHYISSRNGKKKVRGVTSITRSEKSRAFGDNIASTLTLELSDGEQITLSRTADSEKFSVLGELGRIARAVARRFLGGEVIHYRGEGNLELEDGSVSDGYYHFMVVD